MLLAGFMAHGTVNVRLRPINLAFLVNPKDKDSLLKAIEINTFLWGGMYNPIVPTYEEIPGNWEDLPSKDLTPQSLVSGYLDNFDPDYVVPMGECSDYTFDVGNRRTIHDVSDILAPVEEYGIPRYGIGLFEVLNYFINRELKFLRRDPLDLCVPCFGSKYRTFLASVFGTLSENINQIFWERFAGVLEAKKNECSDANYAEFLNARKLFLLRIARYNLRAIRSRWSWEQCIFFLDATNSLDIMDYWNLRAIGWNMIPIPKQFAQYDKMKQHALDFIEANHVPRHSNPESYHHTAILRSRSISEDEHKIFVDALDVPKPDEPSKRSMVVMDPSYPRMWDEWARHHDHVECCNLEAGSVEHDILTNQEKIRFKTLDPKCIGRFAGYSEARFANEIDLRMYDDKELLAEVIPEGDRQLAREFGGFGFRDWRLSRKGLVYLSQYPRSTVSFSVPLAEVIVSTWLKLSGWRVKLLTPGRVAKQMILQLGGKSRIEILAQEGIIRLLAEMNSSNVILKDLYKEIVNLQELLKQHGFQDANDEVKRFVTHLKEIEVQLDGGEKSMSEESVRSKMEKIANQTKYSDSARRILQQLIDAKVIQLGLYLQCPKFAQSSWYSVMDADYELQCPRCPERFSFPAASGDVKWAYRTSGLFHSANQAHGAYTVLLTLRFFSELLDGATTPHMSFTARKGKTFEMEADLALFFQASKFGNPKTELIFAECKTFKDFQESDADKMSKLGNAFPGSVLVFATLKESLRDEEKAILCPLVNRCREYWKNERPINPVLILTGKELFLESFWGSHLEKLTARGDLFKLCDFTQQINLGMNSWDRWLAEEWELEIHATPTTWTTPDGKIVRSDN